MTPLLDLLPSRFKAKVLTIYHYDTTELPPLLIQPSPEELWQGYFSLPIEGDEMTLAALFGHYCNSNGGATKRQWGEDRKEYDYPIRQIQVSILEAPTSLRFHFKRFEYVQPRQSLASKLLPKFCAPPPRQFRKLEQDIDIPEEFSITLANGEVKHYRLVSFVNHHGSYWGGHYTSGRIVSGHKYLIDDTQVTLVDLGEEDWNQALRKAYQVCYVLKDPPQPVAAQAG
jgi:ubiquitin C-terminal hydrolase